MAQFEVGVHTIVFNAQGQILLGHRCDMDLWDLPGGGVDAGETPDEAAIRETREETGFIIAVERLLAVGITTPPETKLGFLFLGNLIGGEACLSAETDDIRFFDVQFLPPNLSPRKRAMIQLALHAPTDVVFNRVVLPGAREFLDSQSIPEVNV